MSFRTFLLASLACAAVAKPANAADKLTVILDWFVNANHEALFAARYCGNYAKQGLDVSFIPPADTSSPARLVAAGQADLAVSYQTDLPFMAEQHLPVMRVATLMDQPLNVLMTLPGYGIHSLADLKGKRVGISVGAGEAALLDGMLASVGLKPDAVTRVQVNFQIEQALMTHSVDAVMGGMRNYELIDLQQRGLHPLAFRPEQNGVPPYDELILVAGSAHAADPKIARFVAALREGTACLRHDPAAIWRKFIAEHPDLDTPLNKAAWWATLPAVDSDPAHLDLARYENFQRFLVAHGALAHPVPVSSYAR